MNDDDRAEVQRMITAALEADRPTQRTTAVTAMLRYQKTGDMSDLNPPAAAAAPADDATPTPRTPMQRYNAGEITKDQLRQETAAAFSPAQSAAVQRNRPTVLFRLKSGSGEITINTDRNNDPLLARQTENAAKMMHLFEDMHSMAADLDARVVSREVRIEDGAVSLVGRLNTDDEIIVGPLTEVAGDVIREVRRRIAADAPSDAGAVAEDESA